MRVNQTRWQFASRSSVTVPCRGSVRSVRPRSAWRRTVIEWALASLPPSHDLDARITIATPPKLSIPCGRPARQSPNAMHPLQVPTGVHVLLGRVFYYLFSRLCIFLKVVMLSSLLFHRQWINPSDPPHRTQTQLTVPSREGWVNCR